MSNLHNTFKPKTHSNLTAYKNVKEFKNTRDGSIYFRANLTIRKVKFSFWGRTAKGVALELDKKLIAKGFEPINILKRK